MRLRVLVGRFGLGQLGREGIDVIMSLAGAVDAVGPEEPGVEPLRAVGRDALGGEHVAELVHEGAGVFLAIEIAALPAPVGPGAGQPVEHVAGAGLGAGALMLGQPGEGRLVGDRAPQEGGDGILLDLAQPRGHAGLAEIFLGQDVARHLAELRRHVDVGQSEDDRAVRVPDLAGRIAELDLRIRALARLGEAAFEAHFRRPSMSKCSTFPQAILANRRTRCRPHHAVRAGRSASLFPRLRRARLRPPRNGHTSLPPAAFPGIPSDRWYDSNSERQSPYLGIMLGCKH